MATPSAVRAALAEFITANITATSTVPALRGLTDPGTIANPPVAIILPAQGVYIDYTVAQAHGVYDITIRIEILVSKASERVAMPLLDAYLAPTGPSSIPAAILLDPTLGGACDYCIPMQANGALDVTWNGVDYLSAEIICQAGAE